MYTVPCTLPGMAGKRPLWDASSVRGLRRHLQLTQEQLAGELGVRQQTVSEWETGAYTPRGASERLLTLVAERADFPYRAEQSPPGSEPPGATPGPPAP